MKKKEYYVANAAEKIKALEEVTQQVLSGESVSAGLHASGEGWCDFCNAKAPQWDYPCESFLSDAGTVRKDGKTYTQALNNIGTWAACDACHELIEAGKFTELLDRMCAQSGDPDDPLLIDVRTPGAQVFVRTFMKRQLDGFMKNRTGPATKAGLYDGQHRYKGSTE